MTSDRDLAISLWEYNQLHHTLQPADFIFVMCSYNLIVADRAADLFHDGMAPFIVVSGGIAHIGDLIETGWDQTEAFMFKKRLIELNVPEDKIISEDKATNCGENIQFSKALLAERNIPVETGIIVQKPYMERRAYAAACKQWPEMSWQVTSPKISYDGYLKDQNEGRLINIMVGDTARIIDYAKKGFQTEQEMPETIENSLKELINRGYNKHI